MYDVRGCYPNGSYGLGLTDLSVWGSHSAFSDADGLLEFMQTLQELSGGKPVGLKVRCGAMWANGPSACEPVVNLWASRYDVGRCGPMDPQRVNL